MLQRPVLVSIVGCRARVAVEQFAQWLADDAPAVRLVALDKEENQRVNGQGLDLVLEKDLLTELEQVLQGPVLAPPFRMHWIVVSHLAGDDQVEAMRLLRDVVVPAAAVLQTNDRPFALTMILLDGSVRRDAKVTEFLSDLAEELYGQQLASHCQIYVLRALLENGFALQTSELDEAAALACQAVFLTNLDVADGAPDIAVPSGINANVLDDKTEDLAIFGRIAVHVIRSLDAEVAAICASQRLREFGEHQTAPTARVAAHWEPPLVTVNRPQLSGGADNRIGMAISGGPGSPFSGAPSLWADPSQEFRRLDQESTRWIEALSTWQREVRIRFESVLRELRDASAHERDNARSALEDRATELWGDKTLERPIPYLREWADRQEKHLSEDSRRVHTIAEGLRLDTMTDARTALERPFTVLRHELARRPNVPLIALFSIATVVGSIMLLWPMFGRLGDLATRASWLGTGWADQAALLRAIAIVAVVVLTVGAITVTFWETHLRWVRAYEGLLQATTRVGHRESDALRREIDLVDRHWHLKTMSSAARHLDKVVTRLDRLTALLERTPRPRTMSVHGTGRMVTYIPRQSAADDATCELIGSDQARALLCNEMTARWWVRDDVERWTRDAQSLLRDRFVEARHAGNTAIFADVRQQLNQTIDAWPAKVEDYVVPAYRAAGLNVLNHQLVFGTGMIGDMTAVVQLGAGEPPPIQHASNHDEVLLCRTQTGLTMSVVSQ